MKAVFVLFHFTYLLQLNLKLGLSIPLTATGQPVPKMGNATNHLSISSHIKKQRQTPEFS